MGVFDKRVVAARCGSLVRPLPSLCPPEITAELAAELLMTSVESGNSRYSSHLGRAYRALCDAEADRWHGFPVAWVEVPEPIWRRWLRQGEIKRSELRRYWVWAKAEPSVGWVGWPASASIAGEDSPNPCALVPTERRQRSETCWTTKNRMAWSWRGLAVLP